MVLTVPVLYLIIVNSQKPSFEFITDLVSCSYLTLLCFNGLKNKLMEQIWRRLGGKVLGVIWSTLIVS